jgi:hypothetical protein
VSQTEFPARPAQNDPSAQKKPVEFMKRQTRFGAQTSRGAIEETDSIGQWRAMTTGEDAGGSAESP